MVKKGFFIGLVTIDFIYSVDNFPNSNEKIVASDYRVTAGGPATNAAVSFSCLGNLATLFGVIGNHPFTHLIYSDLKTHQLKVRDLDASESSPPPVSSIITQSNGDRAVISINATQNKVSSNALPDLDLEEIDIILIDGHQMAISQVIAQQAKEKQIPIVIDGGSWKHGFEKVLPWADYVICSANFYPPSCQTSEEVFAYLSSLGIPHIAITQGEKNIIYLNKDERGEIKVPAVQVVDTLGAGDIFHGAFCHYILSDSFQESLLEAAKIASYSCQFFGTRSWMAQKAGEWRKMPE